MYGRVLRGGAEHIVPLQRVAARVGELEQPLTAVPRAESRWRQPSDCSSMEVALTESERCLAAILASTKEGSSDRLRVAVERAVDAFKDNASRIESISARRGAVADLVALVDRCRHDKKARHDKQRYLRLQALALADPLIREVGRSLGRDDTFLHQGTSRTVRLRGEGHTPIE